MLGPLVVPVMSEVLMKVVVAADDPLMTGSWVVEVGDTPPLLMAAFQLKVCTGIPYAFIRCSYS